MRHQQLSDCDVWNRIPSNKANQKLMSQGMKSLYSLKHQLLFGVILCSISSAMASLVQIPPSPIFPLSVSPAGLPSRPLTWDLINRNITTSFLNITNQITDDFARKHSYCVADGRKDRDSAFPASQSLSFDQCLSEGDPSAKVCSRGELTIYFESIFNPMAPLSSPNCNQTHWSRGCEPGWSSSIEIDGGEKVVNSTVMNTPGYVPRRNVDPRPCCPGFFCPRGLSCMIPCPLGAYCPSSWYNSYWKTCEPYGYQQTPAIPDNHCGGAHLWADVGSSGRMFCRAGFYCPNATTILPCERGHYCRLGSTEQKKCLPFVRCEPLAQEQIMQVYGYMLISVLATTLVVLYGCSDQLMIIQEKRRDKARNLAARQAREYISDRRWEKTKQAARRLSGRLSLKFSASKPSRNLEEMQVLVSSPPETGLPQISTVGAMHNKSVLSARLQSIRENQLFTGIDLHGAATAPSTSDPFNFSSPRTQSQIFKYAYGQIEKEKMHLLDLDGRPRPRMEIAFEDLTMMLKKNGKKILCDVTGKLLPGHITAIMGPSGAGKTTFLNAVAGKVTQSETTGHVSINGKHGSIQSFKKIIGFVPQDDVVHGTLTVEENLYFSAKCRLPSNLPKQERVLVIERIIFALGLDAVRNSLVGTVERRGISGGQRKRVNVGLEMVMEPSLLILDEPTSGLDSTSSRLVLQALRREASVGVNVVVVLHQPNYGLFRMFDDVMFLAKGGRVAYLGPVEEVEHYFTELGFPVPERVNPPDHFMDVLEGIVTREDNSSFNQAMLPVIWMQHMGYKIPEDLQEEAAVFLGGSSQSEEKQLEHRKTLSQEAWEEVKDPLVVFWDGLKSTFPTIEDLSGRRTPGFRKQFWIILERVSKQRFQEARLLAQDYIVLLMAGICLGLLSDVRDTNLGSNAYTFTVIAISLLCMIAALRTFSLDKLHFWRESASGMNRVAYFLAKDTLDHFNTILKPMVYLSMFYFFIDSRSTFFSNYIVTLALVYCVTGVAYIFSIVLQQSTAQLMAVFFPILQTLIASKKKQSGFMDFLMKLTYARWAFEAYIVSNAERYDGVWLITRCGVLDKFGYRLDRINFCIFLLFSYGLVARAIALACLLFCNRSRQR